MYALPTRHILLILSLAGWSSDCPGQPAPADSLRKDSLQIVVKKSPVPVAKAPDLVNTLILDFFTTLNAVHFTNSLEADQRSQVYFYYNFTVSNNARFRRFAFRTNIFNEYGYRYYFDSLPQKVEDQYYIRNTVQVPVWKGLSLQGSFHAKTQFWKTYSYREDANGVPQRYLYSDYFSPGYLLYSAGLSLNFMDNATINLGLVGGKTTRIKNQQIFEDRKSRKLYGLEKGERSKVAYGMNLLVNVPPQKIQKHLAWELSGQLFAPKEQLFRTKGYTLSANNAFHYIFLKYLRLSIRTQLEYNETVQSKTLLINHVSLGFYLSNKI